MGKRQHLPDGGRNVGDRALCVRARAQNLIIEHAPFVTDVRFDRHGLVEAFLVVFCESNPVRVGCVNGLEEAQDRLLGKAVLRKDGRS